MQICCYLIGIFHQQRQQRQITIFSKTFRNIWKFNTWVYRSIFSVCFTLYSLCFQFIVSCFQFIFSWFQFLHVCKHFYPFMNNEFTFWMLFRSIFGVFSKYCRFLLPLSPSCLCLALKFFFLLALLCVLYFSYFFDGFYRQGSTF